MKTLISFLCSCTIALSSCGFLIDEDQIIKEVEKRGYKEPVYITRYVTGVVEAGCNAEDDVCFKILATCSDGERKQISVGSAWPIEISKVKVRKE